MNKLIRALAVTAMLCISQLALAETKIGVVELQLALMNTDVAKAYIDKLNDELSDETEKLKKLQKEVNDLRAKYQKEKDVMKDSEKRNLQDELEEKVNSGRFLQNKVQKTRQGKLKGFLQENSKYMQTAISKVIDTEKLDIVLNAEAVPYAIPALDITNKVTVVINEEMAKDKK